MEVVTTLAIKVLLLVSALILLSREDAAAGTAQVPSVPQE